MRIEDLAWAPAKWTVVATAVNGTSTATKTGVAGKQHAIVGVSISCSGTPATSVQVLIKDGTTVLDQWEIPPNAFAPITPNFIRPYVGSSGNDVSVSVGAMGSGVRGTVSIRGFTGMG